MKRDIEMLLAAACFFAVIYVTPSIDTADRSTLLVWWRGAMILGSIAGLFLVVIYFALGIRVDRLMCRR